MSIKYKHQNDEYKLKQSEDDKYCTLKFSKCDDKFPLWKLSTYELKEFIDYAKKIESLTWKEIKNHRGLRYEVLKNYETPKSISKDVVIRSMRVSKVFRIIGFREDEHFYVIWFDSNHATC